MRKMYTFLLAIIVVTAIPVAAFAAEGRKEIDLTVFTYEELVYLKDQINLAIWQSEEWQEVTVPQGVWIVGEDIPVGKWTIKAESDAQTHISVGTETKNGGTGVKARAYENIKSTTYRTYDAKTDVVEWTVELEEGNYVEVSLGNAIFTPYAGKPSLGFK